MVWGSLQDLVYYTRMFQEEMQRDPTNVELFDMAQSNSEHRQVPTTAFHANMSHSSSSVAWGCLHLLGLMPKLFMTSVSPPYSRHYFSGIRW